MKADKKITHLKELLADNPKTINVVAAGWVDGELLHLPQEFGRGAHLC